MSMDLKKSNINYHPYGNRPNNSKNEKLLSKNESLKGNGDNNSTKLPKIVK
jgi:hypothetical protein